MAVSHGEFQAQACRHEQADYELFGDRFVACCDNFTKKTFTQSPTKSTEGFKEAAEKFQIEAGVQPTVELSTLDNRILIKDAIQSGRVQEATHLVNQLHPELLDNDRYLYFHLQQLHLIELIRNGKIEDALTFAQTQMSESGESNPEVLSELERTLALLAFEKPQNSPFADLLEQSHRQKVYECDGWWW